MKVDDGQEALTAFLPVFFGVMLLPMDASSSRSFYKDLPPIQSGGGMLDIAQHHVIPDDWCVVIVDIVNSTKAIEAGKYKDVNMISASSITAVLNAAGREEIAYIFGGDGATLLVPAALAYDVAAALYGTRLMSEEIFNLEMRAGIVFAEKLREMNAPVRVAKMGVAPGVYQATLSGDGVTLAERIVKDKTEGAKHDITALFPKHTLAAKPPDFKGLQCRWQPLYARNGVDLSIIVQARQGDDAQKAALYADMLGNIEELCGPAAQWKPVSAGQLTLGNTPAALATESKVQTHKQGRKAYLKYLWDTVLMSSIGKVMFALGLKAGTLDGKTYKKSLESHNDYIKFDNTLRLVMDVSQEKETSLRHYFDILVKQGQIFYGIHSAPSALMTCIIFDYASQHFHFIDGSDGGYALAAKQLKQQVKEAAQGMAA